MPSWDATDGEPAQLITALIHVNKVGLQTRNQPITGEMIPR